MPPILLQNKMLEREFDFFGFAFRVVAPSAVPLSLLGRLYACRPAKTAGVVPRFTLETVGANCWHLRAAEGAAWEFDSMRGALQELEYQVCQRVIDAASAMIVLHGATVCGGDEAVFIAGKSDAGKTTLALALAAQGHAVLSDDIALLDPASGMVRPVPRCFHLDERSRRLLRRAGLRLPAPARRHGFVTPADVNPGRQCSTRVRHLVSLESNRGPAPLFTRLPQAAMVARLSEEAGWGEMGTSLTLAALARFAGGAQCWKLRSGRLQPTAAALAEHLSCDESGAPDGNQAPVALGSSEVARRNR